MHLSIKLKGILRPKSVRRALVMGLICKENIVMRA